MTNATIRLQPGLWPDWVADHPWLVSFLTKAEAEARNRGDTCCGHFHMELAFLDLGPPVSEWLETLGLDARVIREDTVELLGMNAAETFGANRLEGSLARGERARGARHSDNPVAEYPLESVDETYTGELLELASAEAKLHGDRVDERHFLVAMAMLLFAGNPPNVSALRYLTGLSSKENTAYDIRVDDDREWMRSLAASHGADPAMFPYDIHGPRP